ncbi:hypothetical protein FRC12_008312 [Ceratobasidium sp. 428]|nr:hypothetical protein FRC12_008312 [Ceratobasidium sp. 428]
MTMRSAGLIIYWWALQILQYANPGDLLALARTNKSSRRFLMCRSALSFWQQAERNLAKMDLPRCPPHMDEPQYAALLFTKVCTICGASTSCRADLYLYVRLCNSCRNTEVINMGEFSTRIANLIPCSPTAGPQNDKTELEYYCLRDDARRLDAKRLDLKNSGDVAALEAWDHEQDVALEDRLKQHGVDVYQFLRWWDYDSSAREMMRQRRETIEARAVELELPWHEWCKSIHYSLYVLWHTLTEQPKLLTENAWKTMFSTIESTLIQSGQLSHQAQDKIARRECSQRLRELWLQSGAGPGRFGPIAAALGVGTICSSSAVSNEMRRALVIPFPNLKDGLKWGCMETLRWAAYNRAETEEHFAAALDGVNAEVPRWVDRVEQDLIKLVRKGAQSKSPKNGVGLVVKSATEPAAHLSDVTRRLLRADCVFKATEEHPLFSTLHEGLSHAVPTSLFYPDLLITRRDDIWSSEYFQSYPEASRVAKALLECLGMPNAANMELKVMGRRFVCGRCCSQKTRDWSGIIGHYVEEQCRYKRARPQTASASSTNLHGLTGVIKEPMVRIVSEEDGDEFDLVKIVPPPKPLCGERGYIWRGRGCRDACDWYYNHKGELFFLDS